MQCISRAAFERHQVRELWAGNVVDDCALAGVLPARGVTVKLCPGALLRTEAAGHRLDIWRAWMDRQVLFLKFCVPSQWRLLGGLCAVMALPPLMAVLSLLGGLTGLASTGSVAVAFLYLIALAAAMGHWRELAGNRLPIWRWMTAFALSAGILLLFFGSNALETAQLSNLNPVFAEGRSPMTSILAIVAISPFLFVGFDTVPQVAEEFSFSPKKARNIMLAAIVWGGMLYAMVTFAVAIAIPYPDMLANMAELRARGETAWATGVVCEMAYGKFGAVVLATAVLGAVCTGINGFYVATTRLLLSMGRGGIIPNWFADIHPKYHSPYKSIIFTICIVLLTPWCGRAVVGWIVDMSAVGTAIAYLYTCLAGYRLTSSKPVAERGAKPIICIIGAVVSIICILLLLTPGSPALIGPAPRWIMLAWIVLGVIFYFVKRAEWSKIPEEDMRERVLGNRNLPVFFKKDAQ